MEKRKKVARKAVVQWEVELDSQKVERFHLLPDNFCVSPDKHDILQRSFDSEHELGFAIGELVKSKYSQTFFNWRVKAQVAFHSDSEKWIEDERDFYFDFRRLLVNPNATTLQVNGKSRKIIGRTPSFVRIECPIIKNPFNSYFAEYFFLSKSEELIIQGMSNFVDDRNELDHQIELRYFLDQRDTVIFINSLERHFKLFFGNVGHGNGISFGSGSYNKIITPYFLLNDEEIKWLNSGTWYDAWDKVLRSGSDDDGHY